MLSSIWIWVGLVPVLLETLVYFVQPTLLTRVMLWQLAEHRFRLARPRLVSSSSAGYRDPGRVSTELPELPARTDLADAVLFCDGPRVALRKAYQLGRRQSWLVGIAIERTGEEIVLRSRFVLVPMSIVLLLPAMALAQVERGASVLTSVMIAALVVPFVLVLQYAFSASSRQQSTDEAFRFLEDELRRALEEPTR